MNENVVGEVAEAHRRARPDLEVSEDLLGVADASGRWQSVNPAWIARFTVG